MRTMATFLLVIGLAGCVSTANGTAAQRTPPGPEKTGAAASVDPACEVQEMTRSAGLMVWSPDGARYLLNKRDAAGTYQLYVGTTGSNSLNCITCSERPNGPGVKRHKLMGRWHPSGKWIVLAAEREVYKPPPLATNKMIQGWILSGIFTNIYATRPDGSEWHRLSDFGADKHADGFTGVPFTSDGKRAVWAQIVDGNIFKNLFGRWELIIADFVEDRNGVPSFTNHRNITPPGANWVEPGNFAPDDRSLVITADIGMKDPQGQDQYILDTITGSIRNLNNTPQIWDEHGVFSPDGEKIFFMSSYPFRNERFKHSFLFLRTEFMLINKDGTGLQQVTHYNTPGYPEYEKRGGLAANGDWHPDGRSISAQTLFLPDTESWTITFKGPCGNRNGVVSR